MPEHTDLKELIKETCLKNGYKLKDQGEGVMDLNPYVYEAGIQLIKQVVSELGHDPNDFNLNQ